MSDPGSGAAAASSATPDGGRQPESTAQATPQSKQEGGNVQPMPEPVPSTSGIVSKGKKLVDPKSRFYKKKRETWEDSIVSAFQVIKISGNWNEDDSSDDDYEEEQTELKKSNSFDNKEDDSALLELAINTRDTYPQVYDAEDEMGIGNCFDAPLETGTPASEQQPVREENSIEEGACALAPAAAPPPLQRISPLSENVMSSMPIYNINLPKETIMHLRDYLGITMATILQEKAIPILMKEKDALIHARSGAGKTVAFAIPVIHHLLLIKPQVSSQDGIRILVVVPTKECAVKTFDIFTTMVRLAPWVTVGLFGGGDHFRTEKEWVQKGVSILVTTPARFLDHHRRATNLFVKNLFCLVVDGLDEILDKSDEKHLLDMIAILNKGLDCPHHSDHASTCKTAHVEATRQTVLVSSSITDKVSGFTGLHTTDPTMIDDVFKSPPRPLAMHVDAPKDGGPNAKPPFTPANQFYMIVPERMKLVALVGFVTWRFKVANDKRILVFAGTQTVADYFADLFLLAYGRDDPGRGEGDARHRLTGLDVYKLNPFMDKSDKLNLFMTFSRTKFSILFCSDSAVKGVELPKVDWVVHLHAPTCTSTYMDRIGMNNTEQRDSSSLALLLQAEKGYVQEMKNHGIPMTNIKLRQSFRHLWPLYPSSCSIDDMTCEIQTSLEDIIQRSAWIRDRAYLAFASWCRMYSSYPENLRHIFRFCTVHMDNYAHSFGLREQASNIVAKARKLHAESRRNPARKRSAPAETAESRRQPSADLPPPAKSSARAGRASAPRQATASTQTPIAMARPRSRVAHSDCKKRKSDDGMELPKEDGRDKAE